MKKILILLPLLWLANINLVAQPTHGVSFQIGVTGTYYKSSVPGSKSNATVFLPTYSFEYGKFSENLFWGGAGLGINLRNIPFYKYANGNTIGIETPEFWFKVKTGLHIHNEFMTHLPFISLGIGKYGYAENYFKSQNGISYSNVGNYKNFNLQSFTPFMEAGTTLINSSFVENKRNIYMTFVFRYYPLNVFKSNTAFEHFPGETIYLQYQLIEFSIIAGLQKNLRKN